MEKNWEEYHKLKREISEELNALKNKVVILIRVKASLTGNKRPFMETLLGLLLQDLEMFLDKGNHGYLLLALPRRIAMINEYIESLFKKV